MKPRWILLAVLGLIVTTALLAHLSFVQWVTRSAGPGPIDRTAKWPDYNAHEFSRYFILPPEAEIVKATETHTLGLNGGSVEFRLPVKRTPEEWLRQIANQSSLTKYKIGPYAYFVDFRLRGVRSHLPGKADIYKLYYWPEVRMYHALWFDFSF